MHGSSTNQPHLCPGTKINLGLCSHKLVTLPQPHASATGCPHQWRVFMSWAVLWCCPQNRNSWGSSTGESGSLQPGWRQVLTHWPVTLTWTVQPAVARSCSRRSMRGRSTSVPCHRVQPGAARGSWAPAGTATGHSQVCPAPGWRSQAVFTQLCLRAPKPWLLAATAWFV